MTTRPTLLRPFALLGALLILSAGSMRLAAGEDRDLTQGEKVKATMSSAFENAKKGDAGGDSDSGGNDPSKLAGGGIDGEPTGKAGFCTKAESPAWWQVDLGKKRHLDHIVVYNQLQDFPAPAEGGVAQSPADTKGLTIWVSEDGKRWEKVYPGRMREVDTYGGCRKGTTTKTGSFSAPAKDDPLKVILAAESDKEYQFVKLELRTGKPLHLDKVQVY